MIYIFLLLDFEESRTAEVFSSSEVSERRGFLYTIPRFTINKTVSLCR
jgi:hypothetical protein